MSETDVLVVGETLVDFIPDSRGDLQSVESFSRRPGGAPANVAVRLSALGRAPWFWTRLATDPFGEYLAETLSAAGVPDRFVTRDADAATSLAFVGHDADADRSFTFYREGTADTRLRTGAVPDEVLDGVTCVYVGGVVLASDPSRSAVLDLVERASRRECTLYFDPNFRPELWDPAEFEALAADVLEHADVVKATVEEFERFGVSGGTKREVCEAACERGPHTVLMTLGRDGAFAYCDERSPWGPASAERPAFGVDAVDTTGAGDAFVAGTIRGIVEGLPLGTTLDTANAMAALSTTTGGAMEDPPSRAEVDRFLSERS
ncbi:carbohydrate kinase family protein [Candidatus Halobonum tyrrellensis]|uniref:PfkB domain-containing protein n=1 Tax=Candidatus Halobonum tyrrellensis G22 TaxID=1324957 RepID=V4HK05_9EURY|nr:carbohydrate kinase [Candidatus Halobonum tyrrellensis]ESP90113.1 PfkB domain-containing protein [Candidatus Halobonum tyrrellensis G22]